MTLWNEVVRVNKVQREEYSTNRNFNGELFLTGILRCPQCGAGTVMSKKKMRNDEGYHFYYQCQANHAKGTVACRSNLIMREIIEPKVLLSISELVNNKELIADILARYEDAKNQDISHLLKEVSMLQSDLKKGYSRRSIIEHDYKKGDLTARSYSNVFEPLQDEIEELEATIRNLTREIEKSTSSNNISKDLVSEALLNFNELFAIASAEERKTLIRSIIKEIEVEKNRKEIKKITFWISLPAALPSDEVRRTHTTNNPEKLD